MILEWMSYATLVGAAVAVVAWVAVHVQRSRGGPVRWVWMAAIVLGVAIPAALAVRPRVSRAGPPVAVRVLPVPTGGARAPAPRSPVALILWGAATLGMLCLVGGSLWSLHRARRAARPDLWEGAEVAVTAHVGPGAAPFGRPAILVPAWTVGMSSLDRHLLLQHELSHVSARDARWLLGATVLVILVPWNLPLWWCLRRLRTAIELDCDARVLAGGAPKRAYAELLLGVAAHPSRRLAPALLALAPSPSQLHTRIDAMTTIPQLTPVRRSALGLVALTAVVVACEARLPEPVAPVADYVVSDGQARAITVSPAQADSAKQSLATIIEGRPVTPGEDLSKPLIIVYDASNRVVYSGRGVEADQRLKGAGADLIASVEVVKRSDLLPADAKSGLITVRLKPGAEWPGAGADAARGVQYRAPAVANPAAAGVRVVVGQPAQEGKARSDAGTLIRLVEPLDSALTRTASPSRTAGEPLVQLIDGAGRVLYEGRGGMIGDRVGPYLLEPSVIQGIEVNKKVPGGLITIQLKAGAALKKAP